MSSATEEPWLIFGSYGLTGRLVVEQALRRGHRPILAGRDEHRLRDQAEATGLGYRVVDLGNERMLRDLAGTHRLVLNAAGPFEATGRPIIEACLSTRTPYVDLAGEIHHLRYVREKDGEARNARISLVTGGGFGVTYADCLAAHLLNRMPLATHLRLSVSARNAQTTPGAMRTMLGVIVKGGHAVEAGRWRSRPLAHRAWQISHGGKQIRFAALPLGELAALYGWTKIPNVIVGRPMGKSSAIIVRSLSPLIRRVLGAARVRDYLASRRPKTVAPEAGSDEPSRIWAEAWNSSGEAIASRLETTEGYAATARAAVANVEASIARELHGAFTPASAFGADHVLSIEGVRRIDC